MTDPTRAVTPLSEEELAGLRDWLGDPAARPTLGRCVAALVVLPRLLATLDARELDVERLALRAALLHQAADEDLGPHFRKGIEFAVSYMDSWHSASDDDPVKRRFRAALSENHD